MKLGCITFSPGSCLTKFKKFATTVGAGRVAIMLLQCRPSTVSLNASLPFRSP